MAGEEAGSGTESAQHAGIRHASVGVGGLQGGAGWAGGGGGVRW
jgi:hypothetical protein